MRKLASTYLFVFCVLLPVSGSAQWQLTSRPVFIQHSYRSIVEISAAGPYLVTQTAIDSTFITSDGGSTWTLTKLPHTVHIKSSAATSVALFLVGDDNWIAMSSDAGSTWTLVNHNILGHEIDGFTTIGDIIIAGTTNGTVYRSSNSGTTWTSASAGLPNTTVISLACDGTTLIAGTQFGGVYYSSDTGASWHAASFSSIGASVLASNGSVTFATTEKGNFVTKDNGVTWSDASNGLGSNLAQQFAFIGSNAFATTITGGAFMSSDSGSHWVSINAGLPSSFVVRLVAVSGTLYALMGDHQFFSSTTNGSRWSPIGVLAAYPLQPLVRTLFSFNNSLFLGTSTMGVILSTDNGASWVTSNSGMPSVSITAIGAAQDTLFAGGASVIYRSIDHGATWQKSQMQIVKGQDTVRLDTSFQCAQILATSHGTFAALSGFDGTGGLYHTTDQGITWTHYFGSTGSAIIDTAGAFFASASFNASPNIFLSTDGGVDWSPSATGLPASWTKSFAYVGSTFFAGTYGDGIYYTTNNGASWLPVASGSTSNRINVLKTVGQTMFAGTTTGVYVSTDGGRSWSASIAGIGAPNVLSIEASNGWLFAATDSSIFRRPLSELMHADVRQVASILHTIAVYPNPASNEITIAGISNDCSTVVILDALGSEVDQLRVPQGTSSVIWSVHSIRDGCYFALAKGPQRTECVALSVQH